MTGQDVGGGQGEIPPPAVRPMRPATAVGQQATPPAAQLLVPAAGPLSNPPGVLAGGSLGGIPGAPIYVAASDSCSEAARVAGPVQAPLDTPGHAADSAEPMPMPQTAWTTAAAAAGPPEVTPMTTAAGIQPPGAPGPPTFVFGAMGGGSLRGIPGAPVHVAASKAVRVACPGQGLRDSPARGPSATATPRRRGRPAGPPRLLNLNGLSTASPTTPTTPGAGLTSSILPLHQINDLKLHNCVNDHGRTGF